MRASSFAFALLLVGCADKGDEGLFVRNNTAPSTTGCSFSGDPTQPFLPHGTIVANSPAGYLMTPLIQSRIDAITGHELERTVHLEGADVVLSAVGADGKLAVTTKFTTLFSGSVAPLGTVNVAFVGIPAPNLAVSASTEMNVNVTVYGTLGGGRIDGEPFDYPVTVCTNCIVNELGPCAGGMPPTPAAANLGNACNPFQDGIVDCCREANNSLRCPGP